MNNSKLKDITTEMEGAIAFTIDNKLNFGFSLQSFLYYAAYNSFLIQ